MMKSTTDVGFIQDLSSLDSLRKKAVGNDKSDKKEALTAAARQFESIFTSMMLKSMRDANSNFKSDLMNSQTEQFYQQMMDKQMASDFSAKDSMGLADMIVAQLGAGRGLDDEKEKSVRDATQQLLNNRELGNRELHKEFDNNKVKATLTSAELKTESANKFAQVSNQIIASTQNPQSVKGAHFSSPESFVHAIAPYAKRAAKTLGVEPSLLIAQAALETGWGKKVAQNSRGSSHNLFNIKADRSWQGDKISTQTLEFEDNTPVKQTAAFRSYPNYQDSFNDYVSFLNNNPRYQSAMSHQGMTQQGNSADFIRNIHNAGYATDPEYANKVLQVKQRIEKMTL